MNKPRIVKCKCLLSVSCLIVLLLSAICLAPNSMAAGDDPSDARLVHSNSMPPLATGEYGTDLDNENNAGSGYADGDMDVYLFNDDANTPIEFNIPISVDASNSAATLRMDVYDVDTFTEASNPEIDEVYLNGVFLGVLNGESGEWGVNIFDIPVGTLKQGNNRVQIRVDVGNAGHYWAVEIDYGVIQLTGALNTMVITKAWFTPVSVPRGNYINAFAEVSGNPVTVQAYYGTAYLMELTDPDGDNTWSGQFLVPATAKTGWKGTLRFEARDAAGKLALWPGIEVTE